MPRVPRLDTPGLLHHVIIRGIERRKIFSDDKDRENLLARLSALLPESKTQCLAWSLLSNHAHFLFKSGPTVDRGTFFTFAHFACEGGLTVTVVSRAKTITIRYARGSTSYYVGGARCMLSELYDYIPQQNRKQNAGNFKTEQRPGSITDEKKQKIDTEEGRRIYSKRLGIVEPVFGNIH